MDRQQGESQQTSLANQPACWLSCQPTAAATPSPSHVPPPGEAHRPQSLQHVSPIPAATQRLELCACAENEGVMPKRKALIISDRSLDDFRVMQAASKKRGFFV
jgi:hypothetical protein